MWEKKQNEIHASQIIQTDWNDSEGSTLEEINQHWNWLEQNLLHTLSVFDNKDDMASFVKGKVKVVSMEKMEDTSLLPSPILISIRSKMAFQFIELKDRETLVETLLERLKQVHANRPVHYDTSTNDKDMVGACSWTHITYCLPSMCSDHKFGDLEMVSCHSRKEREDKSPPLHLKPLTVVLQPLGSQNPDSHLVGSEATPSLLYHGHWKQGIDHGECGT
ncbi:TBC1 domain family member 8 [Sciurus carolinensis]|uniref:TBC1 domain family member 8 n=1 Tax=Sciurus carolinensis TaxID=30640 RepID=A0AA41MF84_SCICA|nr:TBC1 domain family member 8 [Sciurus carolinensis]